ncbi:MAG TPA: N-acetylmuramoyl-L-alanine amidase [Oscillatoriaceae cyanobacterium]
MNKRLGWWAALGALGCLLAWNPARAATLEGIRYDSTAGVVVITLDHGVHPLTSTLDHPDRLVIDLPGARFPRTYQQLDAISGTAVRRVRAGQYQSDTARVVLDLTRPESYKVITRGDEVFVLVNGQTSLAALPTPAPSMAAPTPAPTPTPPPAAAITDVRVRNGNVAIRMTPRRPYWSHVEAGEPFHYTLVFPNTQLEGGLDGHREKVNSGDVLSWQTEQDGADAKLDLALTATPSFAFSAGLGGWKLEATKRPTVPQLTLAPHEHTVKSTKLIDKLWPGATDAPLTLKRVGNQWLLVVTAPSAIHYHTTAVGDDRLEVDVEGARIALPRDSVYIDGGLIARVRVTHPEIGTHLTIDFDQPVAHQVRLLGSGRSLLFTMKPLDKVRATLDPGHGGTDDGAIGVNGVREKDVTLAVATRLARMMEAGGMSVQMTRMKDLEVLLRPRVEMANDNHSDVFVSIHCNSFGNQHGVRGIETYYWSDQSYALAKAIHAHLVAALHSPDRGVRKNNFYVVHHTEMPAALVEIGYLSNAQEEALLASPEYQEKAAKAIYAGIQEFLKNRKLKH